MLRWLLIVLLPGCAATSSPPPPRASTPRTQAAAPPPPAAPAPIVKRDYDRFKDVTRIKSDAGGVGANLKIVFLASHRGETPAPPEAMTLLLVSSSTDGWRFLRAHDLTLIADGVRIELATTHEGDVGRGYVLELVSAEPSYDVFAQLGAAVAVEGQLFTSEFTFNDYTRRALAEFLAEVNRGTPAVAPSPDAEPQQ